MMYSLATDGSGCAFRWDALLILVAMVCALDAVFCLQSVPRRLIREPFELHPSREV